MHSQVHSTCYFRVNRTVSVALLGLCPSFAKHAESDCCLFQRSLRFFFDSWSWRKKHCAAGGKNILLALVENKFLGENKNKMCFPQTFVSHQKTRFPQIRSFFEWPQLLFFRVERSKILVFGEERQPAREEGSIQAGRINAAIKPTTTMNCIAEFGRTHASAPLAEPVLLPTTLQTY